MVLRIYHQNVAPPELTQHYRHEFVVRIEAMGGTKVVAAAAAVVIVVVAAAAVAVAAVLAVV